VAASVFEELEWARNRSCWSRDASQRGLLVRRCARDRAGRVVRERAALPLRDGEGGSRPAARQARDLHEPVGPRRRRGRTLLRDLPGGDPGRSRRALGIGHPRELKLQQPVVDFVLHRPRAEEQTQIDLAIDKALDVIPLLCDGLFEQAMMNLHTSVSGKG